MPYVQSWGDNSAGTTESGAAAGALPVTGATAGNRLVGAICLRNNVSTDQLSGTVTGWDLREFVDGEVVGVAFYERVASGTSDDNLTPPSTWDAAYRWAMAVAEFNDVDSIASFEIKSENATQASSTATSITPGSVTPTTAGLAVTIHGASTATASWDPASVSVGSGYTKHRTEGESAKFRPSISIASLDLSSTDATNPEWSFQAVAGSYAAIIVFEESGSGTDALTADDLESASNVSQPTLGLNARVIVTWAQFESVGGGASENAISGDVAATISPASGMQFNQNPTLAGDVSVTITPTASALVFDQNHALVGDSGFALTPIAAGLAYNQNHTIAGDSAVSLTPASTLQYNAVHAIVGDSSIAFAIAATLDYSSATSNTITGDVTVAVTPAAGLAFNQNPVLAGDSPITLGVSAGLVYSQGNAIVGDVTVAVTPSATLAYNINAQYSGSSAVSLLPAAAMDYHVQQDYTLSGSLTLSLTPASVMSYTLSGDLVLGEVFTVPREIREFNVPKENRIFTVH